MNDKPISDILIDEISEMIKTNITIYYNNDDESFVELRRYCHEHYDEKFNDVDQQLLTFFVEIVLADLINCPFLYDFRALEYI